MVSALLFASSAFAEGHTPGDDDESLPCRPTIACTADIVPPGDLELEVGYLVRREHAGAAQHSTPFLLKLSVTKWLQLQVSSNGFSAADSPVRERFFDDIAIGAKLHLADQHNFFPSLSWSALVSLPTPHQEGYVRTYDVLFTAYITENIGKLHADLNIGMNLWQIAGPVYVQPWSAIALSYELPRDFTVMLEFYYYADAPPIAPRDGGTLFALAYSPRNWVVIDAGFDVGFFQTARAVSGFVGLTMIAGNLWVPKKAH